MATTLQSLEVGGQTVWVEVEEVAIVSESPGNDGRFKKTSTPSPETAARAVQVLQKADLGPTLMVLVSSVQQALAATRPDEVTVEISVGISGTVGFFVAKSEGTASLKVAAKWKPVPETPAKLSER